MNQDRYHRHARWRLSTGVYNPIVTVDGRRWRDYEQAAEAIALWPERRLLIGRAEERGPDNQVPVLPAGAADGRAGQLTTGLPGAQASTDPGQDWSQERAGQLTTSRSGAQNGEDLGQDPLLERAGHITTDQPCAQASTDSGQDWSQERAGQLTTSRSGAPASTDSDPDHSPERAGRPAPEAETGGGPELDASPGAGAAPRHDEGSRAGAAPALVEGSPAGAAPGLDEGSRADAVDDVLTSDGVISGGVNGVAVTGGGLSGDLAVECARDANASAVTDPLGVSSAPSSDDEVPDPRRPMLDAIVVNGSPTSPAEGDWCDQPGRPPRLETTRPYGRPGGLSEPTPRAQANLAQAVSGRFPDPRGTWIRLINAEGPTEDPFRSTNALDCALAVISTWHGEPVVAAPRHPEYDLSGRPVQTGETGGVARAEEWLGHRFEYVGNGRQAYVTIAQRLIAGGHGASAVLITQWPGGGSHAWNAVNCRNEVLWLDAQRGHMAVEPPYEHVTAVFSVLIDRRGRRL